VLAWILVCLPAASRSRKQEPFESAEAFKRGLEVIGPVRRNFVKGSVAEAGALPPVRILPGRSALLLMLLAVVLASSVMATAKGGGLWELQLAADACLALFVAWLLEDKHRRTKRARELKMTRVGRRARAA
jgi:hypothetical protein